MIAALKYFVVEASLSLWRGRRSTMLSTLTIAAALFVLGVFLIAAANLEGLLQRWRETAELSVYLHDAVTPGERSGIENTLRDDRLVVGVEHVSKEAALARFRRDFPDLAPAMADGAASPFPASVEARLVEQADAQALARLASRVGRLPGVADVRYDRQWLSRLATVAGFVRWAGLGLAAVLVLAAALTVSNVVRLALFARRDEIEIMSLVGAPTAFIRGPFVVEGILQGTIGAVIALAALRAGMALVRSRLAAAMPGVDAVDLVFLSPWAQAFLVLGGLVVGCVGGGVAARRLR